MGGGGVDTGYELKRVNEMNEMIPPQQTRDVHQMLVQC